MWKLLEIKWYHHVCNDELRRTTKQPHLLAIIIQAWCLPVQPHCENARWNSCQKILTASPWRSGGDHQDVLVLCRWRTIQQEWIWNPATLREWSNWRDSELSTLCLYVWHYRLLLVHARKKKKKLAGNMPSDSLSDTLQAALWLPPTSNLTFSSKSHTFGPLRLVGGRCTHMHLSVKS